MEPVPDFAKLIHPHLRRAAWGAFPDVVIHAEESLVKKHPRYAVAKGGDVAAAEELVNETLTLNALDSISAIVKDRHPSLLPVHALETEGMNVIPRALAQILAKLLALPLAYGIIQANRVSDTGADGYYRLAFPPLFEGAIKAREYFIVDDFIGQGGTIANLKGLVESGGASVLGATVLTGKAYSAKLRLTTATLQALRSKHGDELEQWWLATFGYSFERLTESEARYLTRSDDAHLIAERIVAARRKRD